MKNTPLLKSDKTKFSQRALDLLKNDGIQSSVMQNALKKLKEEQDKEQEEKALKWLQQADAVLQKVVNDLRDIRKKEKAARNLVKVVGDAFEEFTKSENADFDAFRSKCAKAGVIFY